MLYRRSNLAKFDHFVLAGVENVQSLALIFEWKCIESLDPGFGRSTANSRWDFVKMGHFVTFGGIFRLTLVLTSFVEVKVLKRHAENKGKVVKITENVTF